MTSEWAEAELCLFDINFERIRMMEARQTQADIYWQVRLTVVVAIFSTFSL